MTRGELLEFLTKEAKNFIEDSNAIVRNKHLTGLSEEACPTKCQIKGTLIGFINHIGVTQGIDYALSYKDLLVVSDQPSEAVRLGQPKLSYQ